MKIPFYYRAARAYVRYHIGNPVPVAMMVRLTHKCNLKCPFCAVTKLEKTQMPTDILVKALRDIDKLQVAYVTISGGEPLLHKDFGKIAKIVSKCRFFATLNTNGTLINESNATTLAKSFDAVKMSIDGDREYHDNIRGLKGSYDATVDALTLLSNVKNRKAKLLLHFTVGADNIDKMGEFYKKFQHKCDSISFMPVYDHDRNKVFNSDIFVEKWKDVKRKGKINQTASIIHKPDNIVGKKHCDAGKLYYHVLANGLVTPCSNIGSIVMGNLNEESIQDIVTRKTPSSNLKKISKCPGCFSRCTTEISMIMRNKPWQLLPRLPKMLHDYWI